MKSVFLFILLMSSLFVFYSCNKDDGTAPEEQPQVSINKLYPGAAGSEFNYAITVNNTPAGSRKVTIGETTSINNRTYTTQNNLMQVSAGDIPSITYYRMSGDTLYFYVDTTGLAGLILGSLPSGLPSGLTVSASEESKILAVPLNSGNNWPVYKIAISLGAISINVLEVTGSFIGTEDINLNLTSGSVTKSTRKVQYQLILKIPNAMLQIKTSTFNAFGWYAEDIGLVKLEGNAAVLEALSTTRITLSDTTMTAVQTLNSYSIK